MTILAIIDRREIDKADHKGHQLAFGRNTNGTFKREPEDLAKLIAKTWVDESGERDPTFEKFVRHRFWRPFRYSLRSSLIYSWLFSSFTLLVIAAGLGSSALAALTSGNHDLAIATLGIVVAVVTAVNRLLRPNLRAALRHRTANRLRHEGWSYVQMTGQYKDLGPKKRKRTFIKEVEAINRPAEAIDEEQMEPEGN